MNHPVFHVVAMALVALASSVALAMPQGGPVEDVSQSGSGYSLDLPTEDHVARSVTVAGREIRYRAYEGIVYVQRPVDIRHQSMNIYIPEQYFRGGTVNGYTAETAPIFLPNGVGGYMPSEPESPGAGRDGGVNAAAVALSKGLVVAFPGVRGRTTTDTRGRYTGKAPACIVDLKAAVRYLRRNDAAMPGDAEKIISNGTSAGGALSALLGATGNSPAYEPYLRKIGAAQERDDIFAASCYCPITDLDHADMAYEWQFRGVDSYKKTIILGMIDWHVERKEISGELTGDDVRVSEALAPLLPAYVNGLGLTGPDSKALTLSPEGEGTFKDYVASFVMASAQGQLDAGADLSTFPWLTIRDGKVIAMDFEAYVRHAGRMKTPPAFDGLGLESGENELFGTEDVNARHFTRFGMRNDTADGEMTKGGLVRLMNPIPLIGAQGVSTCGHWRIRHGTVDRDTSLAIPVILATRLANKGFEVDFALPWERPHSGDYDLDELFSWIRKITQ